MRTSPGWVEGRFVAGVFCEFPLDQCPLLVLPLMTVVSSKRFDGNSDFVLPPLKLKPD